VVHQLYVPANDTHWPLVGVYAYNDASGPVQVIGVYINNRQSKRLRGTCQKDPVPLEVFLEGT
jgi:hypothetical protein